MDKFGRCVLYAAVCSAIYFGLRWLVAGDDAVNGRDYMLGLLVGWGINIAYRMIFND